MRGIVDYIVSPSGDRYNNKVSVGEGELILNTEISNHEYINRFGIVEALPIGPSDGKIKIGSKVLINHNVFRRWYDVKGREKNSRSYLSENQYLVQKDQVYMVDNGNGWEALPGYVLVQPFEEDDNLSIYKEKAFMGKVIYSGSSDFSTEDTIGFWPGSEYEFIVDGKRIYRVLERLITINYGKTGGKVYNPSWVK